MQALNIQLGIEAIYLNATQSILAVLILVYSLLLGQENFISRSEAMHRNGVELGRFARKLVGLKKPVSPEEYIKLTEEYYSIIEKYGNHKPIDYLFTQLTESPKGAKEHFTYIYRWIKSRVVTSLIFSHYVIAIVFVAYVFIQLFLSIKVSYPQ